MSKVSKQTPIPWVPTTPILIWKEAQNKCFFQSLLDEPNPNSPANSVAAQLYQVAAPPPCHSYNWTKIIFRRIEGSMRRGWLQSWNRAGTISYSCAVWKIVLSQHQSCLGWCFLKRVKARRWKVNLQQTEAAVESWYNVNTVPFILSDADEWTLQTRNYYNVNSLKFIFRMNSSKIYTVALLHIFQCVNHEQSSCQYLSCTHASGDDVLTQTRDLGRWEYLKGFWGLPTTSHPLIQVLLWEQLHCWKKSKTLSWWSFPVDTTSMNCGVKSQDGPLFLEVAPWDLSIPSLF